MKRQVNALRQYAAIFGLALGSTLSPSALSETLTGLLECSNGYSVLWYISPQSGDLIGRVFSNTSLEGKHILHSCLPGLSCTTEDIEAVQPHLQKQAPPQSTGAHQWHIRHVQDIYGQATLTSSMHELLARLERLGMACSPCN